MKTIKAKQTIAGGSYNRLRKGETAEVTDKVANALAKADLAEIVSDGESDAEEGEDKGGVTITDNTGKEKKEAFVKDEKNKEAGPIEKKADAGPNAEESEDKKKGKIK